MLPLLTKATTNEKMNICMDWCCPTYHWSPQIIQENVDSCIKTHHTLHRWQRGGKKIWNGQGHRSLTSATTAANHLNLNCHHSASNQFWVFDMKWIALFITQGSFLIQKQRQANSYFCGYWHIQEGACGRRATLHSLAKWD